MSKKREANADGVIAGIWGILVFFRGNVQSCAPRFKPTLRQKPADNNYGIMPI